MEIFDTNKSLLENIYFGSGPLLAILGLLIFRQIKLAKNQLVIAKKQLEESQRQLKISSQRQAATLSANLLKDYINEIIPLLNKLFQAKREIKYPETKVHIKNFTNDEAANWDKEFWNQYSTRPENIVLLELDVVNRLEAFSVYFIKGIADEKVAFASVGKTFCNSVELFYPTIAILRGSKNPNKVYENLVDLYRCWRQRLNNSMIDFEKEELSRDLMEKIERLENLRDTQQPFNDIKPIGT